MITNPSVTTARINQTEWYRALRQYEKPNVAKALWQLADTFIPFLTLWALMVYMVKGGISLWLVLPLMALTALLQVRIFIFFHDCTHGSFFASYRWNRIVGYVTGLVSLTPFEEWGYSHAVHHATAGDLDRRGMGDIETLTVEEYRRASRWKRLSYRVLRDPRFLFPIGAPFLFIVLHRFPRKGAARREQLSVLYTDLGLALILVVAHFTIGLPALLMIGLPVMIIAAIVGVWFFYVQHQFVGAYWERHEKWDFFEAALKGSSYYQLPGVLHWFTGNIGFHHIHHMKPRIPNYNLPQCYRSIPELQKVEPLTIRKSLRSLFLNLWDEEKQKMVSFGEV